MKVIENNKSGELSLRQRAETIARQMRRAEANGDPLASPAESQKTLHDLHVHQIELEMQNEALRQKQVELDGARRRYLDLFEFAPVGYVGHLLGYRKDEDCHRGGRGPIDGERRWRGGATTTLFGLTSSCG